MMGSNDDLGAKVDVLIRLVALGVCGDKTQKEKIALLNSAGLSPKEIADVLGTTPNTVHVTLSGMRSKSKKKKADKKLQEGPHAK
jgi:DNA-binding CsgD family transcriptional regulator